MHTPYIRDATESDRCLENLVAWAIKNDVPDYHLEDVLLVQTNGNQILQQWKGLPRNIEKLKTLTDLNLRCLQLKYIPPELGCLDKLIRLDIAQNELKKIPIEIGRLQNLEYLYLSYNRLASFPKFICLLKKLRVISIDFNEIDSIPKCIGNLVELRSISFAANDIDDFPSELLELKNLTLDFDDYASTPIGDRILELMEERIIHRMKKIKDNEKKVIPFKKESVMPNNNFKQNYEKLEEIAHRLSQSQDVDIDELVPMVDEANKAYQICKQRIEAVEKALNNRLNQTESPMTEHISENVQPVPAFVPDDFDESDVPF